MKPAIGTDGTPVESPTKTDVQNYLDCIPWNGDERTLPSGGQILIPELKWSDFAVEGSIVKTKSGIVIDVTVDEKLYKQIVKVYGKHVMSIKRSDTTSGLTREQWKQRFGTDGLKLLILRELRKGKGGVTTG